MCYLAMVTSATENVVVTIKHISSGRGYIGQAQNTIYHDVMACSSVIAFLLHYLFSLRNHARITFVHFHSGIRPGSPLFIFTQESRWDHLCSFSLRIHAGISLFIFTQELGQGQLLLPLKKFQVQYIFVHKLLSLSYPQI